ncbi:thioredoxin-like protein [Xylaria sp. CBS 124048]|nr:thioredoxin-like protein [Xylaria sp. CBS 124048]
MPVELRKRKAPAPAPAPQPPAKKPAKRSSKAAVARGGGGSTAAPAPAPAAAAAAVAAKATAKGAAKATAKATVAKETAVKDAAKDTTKDAPAKDTAKDTAKATAKDAVAKPAAKTNGSKKSAMPAVGDTISLQDFGGEVETNDGVKTTLKALVDESKAGVVLFTYPKASTPGCTNQVCLFRDSYSDLTKDGLTIYGLSIDSPKANTTFKTKTNAPYPLLCDPSATLIEAIGLKKEPKGTTRGVFVVDKTGKVLLAEPGSPAGTVDAVKNLVASGLSATKDEAAADKPVNGEAAEGKKAAEVVETAD